MLLDVVASPVASIAEGCRRVQAEIRFVKMYIYIPKSDYNINEVNDLHLLVPFLPFCMGSPPSAEHAVPKIRISAILRDIDLLQVAILFSFLCCPIVEGDPRFFILYELKTSRSFIFLLADWT